MVTQTPPSAARAPMSAEMTSLTGRLLRDDGPPPTALPSDEEPRRAEPGQREPCAVRSPASSCVPSHEDASNIDEGGGRARHRGHDCQPEAHELFAVLGDADQDR